MSDSSVMVGVDPQGSVGYILRPPSGYQGWYAGQPSSVPIGLVRDDDRQLYTPIEQGAPQTPELNSALYRYIPVPRDAKLRLWLPRFIASSGPTEQTYQYTLHWRLRLTRDCARSGGVTPWSLLTRDGVPDTSSGSSVRRLAIPSARGSVINPVLVGGDSRPLVGGGQSGVLSNGIRDPGAYVGNEDLALGDTYYQPETVTALGDELLITVTRVNLSLGGGLWNFNSASADLAFREFFSGQTSEYPGLGVILYSTTSTND